MKQICFALSLAFYPLLSFSQERETNKLNISIGVSPPIKAEGMGKFFNEDWILDNSNLQMPHERRYFKINTFLVADYFFKRNLFLRLSGGMTVRKIKEQIEQDTTFFTLSYPSYSMFKQELNYSQRNWNASLGIGHRLENKIISPFFGTEFIFIGYGQGRQHGDTYVWNWDTAVDTARPNPTDSTSYTIVIPNGFGMGLGVFGGVDCSISSRILASLEISSYYLSVHFNGTTAQHTFGYQSLGLIGYAPVDFWVYRKDKLQQYAFSNILLRISLKYSFIKSK